MANSSPACDCQTETPRYPHILIIEQPSGTADAAGHIDLTSDSNWIQVGRIKGRFITKGGRESFVFRQVQAETTHVIEVASTPLSRSIVPKWRLRIGTEKYNVTAAYDVDRMRKAVRVEATEVR